MSVMMAATPIAPCFQAAETQTEAQTQEAAAVDNGASPEAETVASAESKEESVPALSEDKASDGETGTETPQPSGGAPSGGEAKDSDAQEAQKANESPQSEAPSKPESEPAAQAPGKEEAEKESGKKVEASFNMPDEDVIVRAQFKTTHSIWLCKGTGTLPDIRQVKVPGVMIVTCFLRPPSAASPA